MSKLVFLILLLQLLVTVKNTCVNFTDMNIDNGILMVYQYIKR